MAASATFALKAGLCVRRTRLAIVAPDMRHSRRSQADFPLIDLSEFARPPLGARRYREPVVLLFAGPSREGSGDRHEKGDSLRSRAADTRRRPEQTPGEQGPGQNPAAHRSREGKIRAGGTAL